MKKSFIATLFLGALALAVSARPATAQVDVNVSIGGFYDEMAPYGRWIDCSYGQCWVPSHVSRDWQPYTNGQWVYTEYGWTWMSDDPWGGNPYHYGTWASVDQYGWCWVPGTVWAPAWVTWSYGNNYVGWAPLPPNVAFGSSGYAGSAVVVNSTQYVFVPTNRFVGSNVASVRVAAQQNATIFRQTTPVTRFEVSGGIVRNTALPVATIQRAAGVKIETRSIQDARATPRSMSAGAARGQQVAIVAPAQEVKAAVASRPQSVPRAGAPAEDRSRKPEASQAPRSGVPQSRQDSAAQPVVIKPQPQEQRAPNERAASPARPRDQAAQAPPQERQEARKGPERAQAPAPETRHEAAPAEQHPVPQARAEDNPRARQAPVKVAPAAKVKPVPEREKSPEKDQTEEKH